MKLIKLGPRSAGFWEGGPDDCWPWAGRSGWNGYTYCWDPRRKKLGNAHRVVYEWLTGLVLPGKGSGMELDHTCKRRDCVNPNHMELVTIAENRRRSVHPPRKVFHGRPSDYARGCRCTECREMWRVYVRERRAKTRTL